MEPEMHPLQVAVVLNNEAVIHHTVFAVNEYEAMRSIRLFYSDPFIGVIFYSTEE